MELGERNLDHLQVGVGSWSFLFSPPVSVLSDFCVCVFGLGRGVVWVPKCIYNFCLSCLLANQPFELGLIFMFFLKPGI